MEVSVLLHKSDVSINLHSRVSFLVEESIKLLPSLLFLVILIKKLLMESWPAVSFMEGSGERARVEEVIQFTCFAKGPATGGSTVDKYT